LLAVEVGVVVHTLQIRVVAVALVASVLLQDCLLRLAQLTRLRWVLVGMDQDCQTRRVQTVVILFSVPLPLLVVAAVHLILALQQQVVLVVAVTLDQQLARQVIRLLLLQRKVLLVELVLTLAITAQAAVVGLVLLEPMPLQLQVEMVVQVLHLLLQEHP
jgi:hypothetical protein